MADGGGRSREAGGPPLSVSGALTEALAARSRSRPDDDPTETIRIPRGADALGLRLPRLSLGSGEDVDIVVGPVLGRGGMGEVRLAEQRSLGREVAIKRPGEGLDTQGHAELVREGVITGALEHPNVVPVHLMGVDHDGEPVIVMKHVAGVSWRDLIADDDHVAWRGTKLWSEEPTMRHLEILFDVASALELAHSRGWVHRDVKPANVMVGAWGEVYLLDWGIATEVGTAAYVDGEELPLGTPSYMAPEMVALEGVVDERTDVYLLGACLYEVLEKRAPHPEDNLFVALQAAARCDDVELDDDVPAQLAAIVRRAMARDPASRFPSVRAFREALGDHRRQRHSLELARDGDAALARLEAAVAGLGDEPERRALVDVHAAFAEARFAYLSALRSWSDNGPARDRLGVLLAMMIRHELAHGSVDAAEVLLGQLPDHDATLEALVADGRRARAASARRLASLLEMERELDTGVGRRERLLFFLVASLVGAVSVLLIVPLAGRPPIVPPDPRPSIILLAVVAAGLGAALGIGRRWLLETAVNRRIVALMFLALAAVAVHRWIAGGVGVAHATVVTNDLLLEAVIAAAGAVAVDRRMAVLAMGFGAGVIASRFWVDQYILVFLFSNVLALGAGGVALSRG